MTLTQRLNEATMPPLKDLTWHTGNITPHQRQQLLLQRPLTIWLTGLSGSGKSTLAAALERQLWLKGHACYVLDGDNVRHGLNQDLGFSPIDRKENIRRIAEVARLMNDAGLIVITAFISPYREDRASARNIIGAEFFREIHVSTPLSICEQRDPKGLYHKARQGQLAEFTGISAPYEAPLQADMTIDTSSDNIDACIERLLATLNPDFSGFDPQQSAGDTNP